MTTLESIESTMTFSAKFDQSFDLLSLAGTWNLELELDRVRWMGFIVGHWWCLFENNMGIRYMVYLP